jgi:RNA polymerase sigma-70 factor, ECF subfamily
MSMNVSRVEQRLSDKELVRGCLDNNRLIQRALFDQYKASLYTLAYRLLNSHDESNDVLQDAFIEIFSSLGNFGFRSSLYTWMRTIVVRMAIARIKEQNKLQIVDRPMPEVAIQGGFNFTAKHLEEAIFSLPEHTRAVFVLVEVEGYKHREVADILGISSGTSKSQLNYAKKILKHRLTAKTNEERI